MRICAYVLGLLLIATISFAAEINGTWVGEYQNPFGGFGPPGEVKPMVLTFGFKADGESLTGYNVPEGMQIQVPIREGIIKGNKIWFLVDANIFGQQTIMRYKGKVKGDKLKLYFKSVSENQPPGGFAMGETQVTLKRQ